MTSRHDLFLRELLLGNIGMTDRRDQLVDTMRCRNGRPGNPASRPSIHPIVVDSPERIARGPGTLPGATEKRVASQACRRVGDVVPNRPGTPRFRLTARSGLTIFHDVQRQERPLVRLETTRWLTPTRPRKQHEEPWTRAPPRHGWKAFRNHERLRRGTRRPTDFFSCMTRSGAPPMEDKGQAGPAGEPTAPPPRDQTADGDYGGPFGYGHPAHRPDPSAIYSFRRWVVRLLPVEARKRWR